MESRPKRKDHLFDPKNIISGLLNKYADANAETRRKVYAVDKVLKLLAHLGENSTPEFLDFQLAQLISDASHVTSVALGKKVFSARTTGEGMLPEPPPVLESKLAVMHYGGPNQFTQPGCETACLVISLIFALLYLDNADMPFKDFVQTIEWSNVMKQAKDVFRAWRTLRDQGIIAKNAYPIMTELWKMPALKRVVSPYVAIDRSGYYKTETFDQDGKSDFFLPFVERLKRIDAAAKKRKTVLVHVVASIHLAMCIVTLYNPLTDNVSYVIYDPHGTEILQRETATHYAANFRRDDMDRKAFLVEYPSLDVLLAGMTTIPFCALQEIEAAKDQVPREYVCTTIAREDFDY